MCRRIQVSHVSVENTDRNVRAPLVNDTVGLFFGSVFRNKREELAFQAPRNLIARCVSERG